MKKKIKTHETSKQILRETSFHVLFTILFIIRISNTNDNGNNNCR